MHLKADGACTGLALALTGGVLSQVGEILLACAIGRRALADYMAATVIHKNFQMHLGLATQFIDMALELALIGANGLAQALIIAKYGSKPEWKHRGVLETIGDDAGVIHAGFLIESVSWVVFADDNSQFAGGIKKYLVSAYSEDRNHRDRLAMTG